jgi:alcohol dehydrogenase class IV
MRVLPIPDCFIGSGAIRELPGALRGLGARRLLVVTDAGVVKAGLYDTVKAALAGAAVQLELFDRVKPDPSTTFVQSAAEEARRAQVDAVLGLGGGSSIDTAKMAAALAPNRRNIDDYLGGAAFEQPVLPILAVPTTAGTGSEATHIAILSDEAAQVKKGLVSVRIMPRFAFLDPELTLALPPAITAVTAMDALCHAIESYTSLNANEYTEVLSLRAVELLDENILEVFRSGRNAKAREKMLLGSFLAGVAFANAGVAAVHAFAYPLGGMFHVAHGLANSLMMPTILRFNSSACAERYARIGRAFTRGREATAESVVRRVEELSRLLELPRNLAAIGIPADALEPMSQAVVLITRLLNNNPRKVSLEDARAIYREAFSR